MGPVIESKEFWEILKKNIVNKFVDFPDISDDRIFINSYYK